MHPIDEAHERGWKQGVLQGLFIGAIVGLALAGYYGHDLLKVFPW